MRWAGNICAEESSGGSKQKHAGTREERVDTVGFTCPRANPPCSPVRPSSVLCVRDATVVLPMESSAAGGNTAGS